MPLYEFLCRKCDREFTIALSLQAYEKKDYACPRCQGKDVERVVTAAQVITSKKS